MTVLTATPASADNELATYAYSYPHKSSYRPFTPPRPWHEIWCDEPREQIALYMHIPFCEARCGFCNLFARSQPDDDQVEAYLGTLQRQIEVIRERLGPLGIRSLALGGGTPTWLTTSQLSSLFNILEQKLEFTVQRTPTSVETSPATATSDRLETLAEFGVERISLGVQAFDNPTLGQLGRPQSSEAVHRALDAIRSAGFPILNIDLIYGTPEQTAADWMRSLSTAMRWRPEELYLYPLYTRPETGLARLGRVAETRSDLYRLAREFLREQGYQQSSLRCFRLARLGPGSDEGCLREGMIGLGCGARSYTQNTHHATRFAVTQAGVRTILDDWIRQTDTELGFATHGYDLDHDEQRRRFLILSLLRVEGLATDEYVARFNTSPEHDFPLLADLRRRGWLCDGDGQLVLTEEGIEHSDLIGPLFYSPVVRTRLREFVQR